MSKGKELASLRERDAEILSMRQELRMDPSAYVDLVFVHLEEGLRIDVRCVACEGELQLLEDQWWRCEECGYEFGPDEMRGLVGKYSEALDRIFPVTERKKERWVWVHWLLRLLGITR